MADVTWYIATNPATGLPSPYRQIPAGRALDPLTLKISVPDGIPLDVVLDGIDTMLGKARNLGQLLSANMAVELTLTDGPTWPIPEPPAPEPTNPGGG